MSKWIECVGNECPVTENTEVEVRFPDGGTTTDAAGNFGWSRSLNEGRIVAYRVASEEIAAKKPTSTVQKESPLQKQEGGSHYKNLPIQPAEYILANKIPYAEGNVIKYVSRWRDKGGIQDLKKAIHYLEMLIEHEEKKAEARLEGK